jgi:hypothetical protein
MRANFQINARRFLTSAGVVFAFAAAAPYALAAGGGGGGGGGARRHAFPRKPRQRCVLTTEDSSLFGSRSRADSPRSASATSGDAAVLQLAANSGNLSLTEASI